MSDTTIDRPQSKPYTDPQALSSGDGNLATGSHETNDPQDWVAPGSPSSSPANVRSNPMDNTLESEFSPTAKKVPNPTWRSPSEDDGYALLRLWAECFESAQDTRIANENRIRNADVMDGMLSEAHPLFSYVESLRQTEKVAKREMLLTYRRVVPESIQEWQKAQHGIGDHTLALLMGHLGDPLIARPMYWETKDVPEDHVCTMRCSKPEGGGKMRHLVAGAPFERTLAQLWQFCGHGAPGRMRKGMTQEEAMALGNPRLKVLTFMLAEAAMKSGGRGRPLPDLLAGDLDPEDAPTYRAVYESCRLDYADKVHTVECVRCGPKGKPAQPESPWNDGHKHAGSIRRTGKEILRDIWTLAGGAH